MMKRGVYKNSLSYYILLALEKSIDGYVLFDDFIHHPMWDRNVKKSELSYVLKRLREEGFVQEDKVDAATIVFKLTDSGRIIIKNDFDESKWDGKYRIVIFDIPEQKRIVRNLFRRNIKKWGFKQLQKSVWISKMDIYDKLVRYINELGIDEWVTVIEADKLSNL